MPANRPEDDEEELDDEDEMHCSNTNRGCRFSRSRALTALLAAAGVGTVAVISRAASGKSKTSITSDKQVANVVTVDVPGYEVFGPGRCQDAGSSSFSFVQYIDENGIPDVNVCGARCLACVGAAFPTQFVGFYHDPTREDCICAVSQPLVCDDLTPFLSDSAGECKAFSTDATSFFGTGPIANTRNLPGYTCYKFVGGGSSKSGKTPKAAKRG